MLSVSYIYIYIYIYYNPVKLGFCFLYNCAVVLWCAQITEYIMARWTYSFVCTLHHLIFIIMQTYLKVLNFLKACQVAGYTLSSVCLRLCLSQFSPLFNYLSCNIWGCVAAYPFLMWWLRELYLIVVAKSKVRNIDFILGLGHETMVCAVCLSMFVLSYKITHSSRNCTVTLPPMSLTIIFYRYYKIHRTK